MFLKNKIFYKHVLFLFIYKTIELINYLFKAEINIIHIRPFLF